MKKKTSAAIQVAPEWGEKLLSGEITLGTFVGFSREVLYQIADIGYQLFNSGRLEQARHIYRGLVAASPFDHVFHCHLGAVLYRMGEHAQALKSYNRALELNPRDVDALAGRGELRLQLKQTAEGIADLEAALCADPELTHQSTIRAHADIRMLAAQRAAAQAGSHAR